MGTFARASPDINLTIKLPKVSCDHEKDRNELRKLVVNYFMKERAGHGNKEKTSQYRYIVETLISGKKVYLTRPVPLNKGFDFIVHVEGYTFQNGKDNPRHDDIYEDLKTKKKDNVNAYIKLVEALDAVFHCYDPDDIYRNYKNFFFSLNRGLSPELILKVVKWFFIEQDIRYWNWSGRNMFMDGIKRI